MSYLGGIYLFNKEKYLNNFSKAAAIFQYCAKFSEKYNFNELTTTILLYKAFEVEKKFLESIGLRHANSNIKEINDYKIELDQIRDNAKKGLQDLRDVEKETIFNLIKREEEEKDQDQSSESEGDGYNWRDSSSEFIGSDSSDEETLGLFDAVNFNTHEITFFEEVQACYQNLGAGFINNNKDKDQHPGLVQKMIKRCFDQLGPLPIGCKYAFISFGSLASGKMTPWSDLEFGILINESSNESKNYFRQLTQLLHIKIVNLGETPLRSMAIEALNDFKTGILENDWFWDDVLISGFNFDGPDWHACKTPLGRSGYKVLKNVKNNNGIEKKIFDEKRDFELIDTPQNLLRFQEKEWSVSDPHLVHSLKTVSLIYGEQDLLDTYRQGIYETGSTAESKENENKLLHENINLFSLEFRRNAENKFLDVKKNIFRTIDRTIESLTNYYNIVPPKGSPGMTAWESTLKLYEESFIKLELKNLLQQTLSIACHLRLALYCYYGQQEENFSINQVYRISENKRQENDSVKKVFVIEDTTLLSYFFLIIRGMQQAVKLFCKIQLQEKKDFFNLTIVSTVNDDHYYIKALINTSFRNYSKAKEYFELALMDQDQNKLINFLNQDEVNDKTILTDAYFLFLKIGNYKKASICIYKLIDKIENECKSQNTYLELADGYNKLGVAHVLNGKYCSAIDYYWKGIYHLFTFIVHEGKSEVLNSQMASIFDNLGAAYTDTGNYKFGLKYCNLALKIYFTLYKNIPSLEVAICKDNIGKAHLVNEEFENAETNYIEAFNIKKLFYYSSPFVIQENLADSYDNLGRISNINKKYDEALEFYSKALDIKYSVYNRISSKIKIPTILKPNFINSVPLHPDFASSYDNLGETYCNKGDYDKAIKYHLVAKEIYFHLYKKESDHPAIAFNLMNLGTAYMHKKEIVEALEHYSKAVNVMFSDNVAHPQETNLTKLRSYIFEMYLEMYPILNLTIQFKFHNINECVSKFTSKLLSPQNFQSDGIKSIIEGEIFTKYNYENVPSVEDTTLPNIHELTNGLLGEFFDSV